MAKGRAGIKGLSRLRRLLRRLPDDTKAEVRVAVNAAMGQILREMLRRVPHDTGEGARELRILMSRDGLSGKAGVIGARAWKKAFHLLFAEYGTSTRAARPFLWPAAEAMRPKVVPIIRAAVDRALEKAAKRS